MEILMAQVPILIMMTDTLVDTSRKFDASDFRCQQEVAPGAGQRPHGVWMDIHAEELAFPKQFCGRRPDDVVPITYSQQVRWELRHVDRRFAQCIDNLFFKMRKLQIKFLNDNISIALRTRIRGGGEGLTAADVRSAEVRNYVSQNDGYPIVKNLRGSPDYFRQAKKHVFSMCRQLGTPTWFLSLSAAAIILGQLWYQFLL
eukprot:Lithocolla_globosa_v1_NODE_3434_length_1669_cov_48.863693.p1 type:complete len:201 gc:universal NODE_3434_length_1669_cov_48.863693:807-1409(+)